MKLTKKTRILILALSSLSAITLMAMNVFYHDIKKHTVEIQDKSPLFPYTDYDYMTTEETFYNIDGKLDSIPAFFRTDFASIPKLFWFVEAPYKASFVYAAIWHDYYYTCPGKIPRKDIDDVFYHLLREQGNSMLSSLKMYIAVRIFGYFKFSENLSCHDLLIQQESDELFYREENPDGKF